MPDTPSHNAVKPPVEVFVGIGSNVEREKHIRRSLELLEETFGALRVSPIYECPAVGFDGQAFYNLAASFSTNAKPVQLVGQLRDIEDQCGRDRSLPKFAPRTLDIDLLLHGDAVIDEPGLMLPRADILDYDFVLKPLVDLAPELLHPVCKVPLADLWAQFDKSDSALSRVSI